MPYDIQLGAGHRNTFPYVELPKRVAEEQLRAYARGFRKRCDGLAKKWSPTRNSEWLIRSYLALKSIVDAAAAVAAAREGRRGKRKKQAQSEQVFRALEEACRACVLLLPDQPWKDGDATRALFERVFHVAGDSVSAVSHEQGRWMGSVLEEAYAWRRQSDVRAEHPLQDAGPPPVLRLDPVLPAIRLLCELAQWRSEVLAQTLEHRLEPPIGWDFAFLAESATPTQSVPAVLDEADARRVGALMGAVPHMDDLHALLRHHLADEPGGLLSHLADEAPDADDRAVFPLR